VAGVHRERASAALDRSPSERLLAWVYTGPPGRLWSPLADVVVLWTRWMWGRARARVTR